MKKMELIVKNIETEKNKFKAYTFKDVKTDTWYKVKFVNGCNAPEDHEIDKNIRRAYIGLEDTDDFNITTEEREYEGKVIADEVIYVSGFTKLTDEEIEEMKNLSKGKIEKFRDENKQKKIDFCTTED